MLSLADAKAYLRVDFADDDALITALIAASKDHIETFLKRPIDSAAMTAANQWTVPKTIDIVQQMLVTHWYENRGIVGPANLKELPFTVKSLLTPYRLGIYQ
ncbi:head-tail connector protein [Ectobacillus ponti]|uniref:Head-tail connector protein n=1 Tax=Ectobacillus ponti TaxID=2961894 RepID=A0AA41X896_9BACI|nr:head-tail connector protein [Ectobacillus ponti]MCP8970567.1 head-tail connector protein [Ectobacillus ponti]